MKPETRDFLEKARIELADARKIAALPIARIAARSAYYAAFHAAEALIFERTGKIAKTHSGVRSEFARLLKENFGGDWILLPFLARAYKFKEIGDYGIGEGAKVTDQDAANLIDAAAYFVLGVTEMIGGRKGSHG